MGEGLNGNVYRGKRMEKQGMCLCKIYWYDETKLCII